MFTSFDICSRLYAPASRQFCAAYISTRTIGHLTRGEREFLGKKTKAESHCPSLYAVDVSEKMWTK